MKYLVTQNSNVDPEIGEGPLASIVSADGFDVTYGVLTFYRKSNAFDRYPVAAFHLGEWESVTEYGFDDG